MVTTRPPVKKTASPPPAAPPPAAPPAPLPPAAPAPPVMTQDQTNVWVLLENFLKTYHMESLTDIVKGYVIKGYSSDAATILLQQTPEFLQVFPAIKEWQAKGFSVGQYMDYKNRAITVEQNLALPKGFLTDADRMTKLIESNVSMDQIEARAKSAIASSLNANTETKSSIQRLYGIDQAGLAAYYLDPDNSLPYLQKMSDASAIAGAAAASAFTIDRTAAEGAVNNGMSTSQATQSFQQADQMRGLTSEGDLSQNDLVGAALGKTDAQAKVTGKTAQRKAMSAGGGGAASEQSGFSGLGASSS